MTDTLSIIQSNASAITQYRHQHTQFNKHTATLSAQLAALTANINLIQQYTLPLTRSIQPILQTRTNLLRLTDTTQQLSYATNYVQTERLAEGVKINTQFEQYTTYVLNLILCQQLLVQHNTPQTAALLDRSRKLLQPCINDVLQYSTALLNQHSNEQTNINSLYRSKSANKPESLLPPLVITKLNTCYELLSFAGEKQFILTYVKNRSKLLKQSFKQYYYTQLQVYQHNTRINANQSFNILADIAQYAQFLCINELQLVGVLFQRTGPTRTFDFVDNESSVTQVHQYTSLNLFEEIVTFAESDTSLIQSIHKRMTELLAEVGKNRQRDNTFYMACEAIRVLDELLTNLQTPVSADTYNKFVSLHSVLVRAVEQLTVTLLNDIGTEYDAECSKKQMKYMLCQATEVYVNFIFHTDQYERAVIDKHIRYDKTKQKLTYRQFAKLFVDRLVECIQTYSKKLSVPVCQNLFIVNNLHYMHSRFAKQTNSAELKAFTSGLETQYQNQLKIYFSLHYTKLYNTLDISAIESYCNQLDSVSRIGPPSESQRSQSTSVASMTSESNSKQKIDNKSVRNALKKVFTVFNSDFDNLYNSQRVVTVYDGGLCDTLASQGEKLVAARYNEVYQLVQRYEFSTHAEKYVLYKPEQVKSMIYNMYSTQYVT